MRAAVRVLFIAIVASLASPAALAQVAWADWVVAVEGLATGSASGSVGGVAIEYVDAVREEVSA